MTAKDRLNRIKTVINGGGVYRDYTDSTQVFNADISEVEKALTSYDQLVKEHELTIKLFNSANEQLNELEKDVKRFMELYNPPQPDDEYDILRVKLSKVGKEE